MQVSLEDRARVEEAIRQAETRTGADFVCVLTRNASSYEFFPLAWASLLALVTPWICLELTVWPFAEILVIQLAVFVAAMLLLSTPVLRRRIVPRRVQRAAAHRAAAEQFLIRDLASTPSRRGILLFVSQDEHYARILADDGVAGALPQDHWRRSVDLLIAEARLGRHAAAFVAALEHCADALEPVLPPGARSGEGALPDRFYVMG